MKLGHAVRIARTVSINEPLTPEQMLAIFVLAELGQRIVGARPSMRVLWKVVSGDEELNQMELPSGEGEGG